MSLQHYIKLFFFLSSTVLFTPIKSQCTNPALSTHVLNSVTGLNAANVSLAVYSTDEFYETTSKCINQAVTDANGRVASLIPAGDYVAGHYLIRYRTNEYFSPNQTGSVFPYIEMAFTVVDTCNASHIPIVISPYAYTTYQGRVLPPAP